MTVVDCLIIIAISFFMIIIIIMIIIVLDEDLDDDHLDPAVAEGDLLQVRQLCDEHILSQPRDLS